MTLLLAPDRWNERQGVATGLLADLADGLARELEPLVLGDLYIPREKALLSREGGRCAVDGSLLEFDPFRRHDHRCAQCGRSYRGPLHDRFWLYWYQLWLAERALHAALLHRLRGDERHADLARRILSGYADAYLDYPNVDNVLGPGRVFFSTYLESIWLLQLILALDLLVPDRDGELGGIVRDRIIEPSASLIVSYNEGASNRQTWNNAALLAATLLLDRRNQVESIVEGPGGVKSHLSRGLLADGMWFEGENYHLFAHRGLWYAMTLLEAVGLALPTSLVTRFDEGFAAPFATALPDMTLVSRRDSQYAISLRQIRFAELCELGLARGLDGRLVAMLNALYDGDAPRRDTGRARSTADVERNGPATALTRADLGWRSLVYALARIPALPRVSARSTLLESQGIAVFRRDDNRVYVALDFGHSGGGHGHPDRLNLLLADGTTRWLDDMGTGSYVDRSLFWYRSTLSHNAPLFDGRSQERVHGRLLAFDERGAAGWIDAAVDGLAPDVGARRSIVVMPDYLVDELVWEASRDVVLDLPFHVDGDVDGVTWEPFSPVDRTHADDGFAFISDAQRAAPQRQLARLTATVGEQKLDVWFVGDRGFDLWRTIAPGPPGGAQQRFHVLRCRGDRGRLRTVVSWRRAVAAAAVDGEGLRVGLADGTYHFHTRRGDGWRIELLTASARSSIDLNGRREAPPIEPPPVGLYGDATAKISATTEPILLPATLPLGERHYRRSEVLWRDAGSPTAVVSLQMRGVQLHIEVDIAKEGEPIFAPAGAVNLFDNEHADINGDGIQLYVRRGGRSGGWVLVPESPAPAVRIRAISGWQDLPPLAATWRRTSRGYSVSSIVTFDDEADVELPIDVDAIVNDMGPGRSRRRGQLVMSGANDEFVYLAGDRHDPARLLRFLPKR